MRKIPIHNENRPIITEARSAQEAPSWSPPNQPIFTLKDYQQLFGHLPTTFFNQLTFYYKDRQESEKQETSPPTTSINTPTTNRPIGITEIPPLSPTINSPIRFGNVSLPNWLWKELYQLFSPLPKSPTHEQEPREAPLPKVPTDASPEREPNRPIGIPIPQSPRPIPLMLPPTHEPEREPLTLPTHLPKPEGPFITYVPPTFRPMDLLQMSSVKGTVYTSPNAYQPVIPRVPPIHNMALDNNLLTL